MTCDTYDFRVRQGTAVKIRGTFQDANDVVFDPDVDVLVSHTDPNDNLTTAKYTLAEITRESEGIYVYWLDTRAASGDWTITMYSDDSTLGKHASERKTIRVEAADAVAP